MRPASFISLLCAVRGEERERERDAHTHTHTPSFAHRDSLLRIHIRTHPPAHARSHVTSLSLSRPATLIISFPPSIYLVSLVPSQLPLTPKQTMALMSPFLPYRLLLTNLPTSDDDGDYSIFARQRQPQHRCPVGRHHHHHDKLHCSLCR